MTIQELKVHLTNLVGHVTFIYNGFSCGIDPLAKDLFEVWCGDDAFSVSSVDEVLNDELFDGRSLTDIWDDVTDLDF